MPVSYETRNQLRPTNLITIWSKREHGKELNKDIWKYKILEDETLLSGLRRNILQPSEPANAYYQKAPQSSLE